MPLQEIRLFGAFTAKSGALLALALLGIGAGLRYTVQISGPWPPPDVTGALDYIDKLIPVEVWGAWWGVSGILCLVSSLVPHTGPRWEAVARRWPAIHYVDALAPVSMMAICLTWAFAYFVWFVVGLTPLPYGNATSWFTVVLYGSYAAHIYFAHLAGRCRKEKKRREA